MSLDFGTRAQTRYVSWGTMGDDEMTAGTIFAWIYPTDAGTGVFDNTVLSRWTPAPGDYCGLAVGDQNVSFQRVRATLYTVVTSSSNNVVNNAWQFVAAVWNTGGVNGDQKAYWGNLTTIVTEVATYTSQAVGSGALTGMATNVYTGGNPDSTFEVDFAGRIAIVGRCTSQLTLGQLQTVQWRLLPALSFSATLFSILGYAGTGTQPDWSGSGNNGTVTSATVGDHVPIGLPFGFDLGWMGAFTSLTVDQYFSAMRYPPQIYPRFTRMIPSGNVPR